MHGGGYESARWKFRDKELSVLGIWVDVKDGLPHPCRISWRIIKRTIFPWIVNIGVTAFPQLRPKIIGKGQKPKSIILHMLQRPLIITATNPLWFQGRRSLVLVSSTISPTEKCQIITVLSATMCFARIQEFLRKSMYRILLKTFLASSPTRVLSRVDSEDPREVGLKLWNSGRSPKINGRKS